MATIIHVGDVAASATGNGGLGVVSLGPSFDASLPATAPVPAGLVATNLVERGALFTREKVQITDGVPNRIATMACHAQSLINYGRHLSVASLNPDPLDVAMSSDQRWVAGYGSWVVTGPDVNHNYVSTWASVVGSGATLQFGVDAGEATANPDTGILTDGSNQYWSRIGKVTLPVVIIDQNPCLVTPGPDPIQTLTAMLVATPYEGDWFFGDLMAFYDPTQYDPIAAKLATLRMEADELQLWVKGQRYTERVVNPWARSIDIGQQLDGRRPVIVGWSIDVSNIDEAGQSGRGSLVVIDPYSSSGVDYHFWNRSGEVSLGSFLRIGMIGAASLISNPFNASVVDWLMRLDLYEFNLWQEALDLDQLLAQASKLDSVYGVVQ